MSGKCSPGEKKKTKKKSGAVPASDQVADKVSESEELKKQAPEDQLEPAEKNDESPGTGQ